ncbi:AmmeMemoRadiSam system protein A [Candidatus Peregrinibacteria bacterium]|nr:AmmeMemoRadiSam system protein A [Candidatus Peregrinibacteria bacterium]
MKKELQKHLLNVAKGSIARELKIPFKMMESPKDNGLLNEKRGVFVTLKTHNRLRGCIGNIKPIYPLVEAVSKNAISAAFFDPRFVSLSKDEFTDLSIEISVLTVPKKINYCDCDELCRMLIPHKHGVVLKKGSCQSTYLPQVWEQIPDVEMFLGTLCQKAGLDMHVWRNSDIGVMTYEVEKFRD